MGTLTTEVATLKSKGFGPVSSYLLVLEAGEMERIMALLEQFPLSATALALARDYVTLRMVVGASVDQVIRELERMLSMKGEG